METDEKKRKLIVLVGMTGSGKSILKEKVITDILQEDTTINPYVSVDDVFEKNKDTKKVCYAIYSSLKGNSDKFDTEHINTNIDVNEYLKIIEGTNTIKKDCVLSQLKIKYPHDLKNKHRISISKFISAVYFAFRRNGLDKEYDESIEQAINNKKNIIIESNGETPESIRSWWTNMNTNTEDDNDCYKPSNVNVSNALRGYEKHIVFISNEQPCDIIDSIRSRLLNNIDEFLKDKDNNGAPRLPEIDIVTINEKMDGIRQTFDYFNNNKDGIHIHHYINHPANNKKVTVYNLVKQRELVNPYVNKLSCTTPTGGKRRTRKNRRTRKKTARKYKKKARSARRNRRRVSRKS
jgi:tRNA A37 threonylcarbamoyladenosine biosynthesis protein TsaE